MANFFNLTLDTQGPANPSLTIQAGATYATQRLVTLTIGTTDSATDGYQMLIWGDVDTSYDANIQATQGASSWITFATSKQVTLSTGDGSKSISVIIRDDVSNPSGTATDSIILNTTLPTVSISGPDVSKISKITGKNICSFSFQSDASFTEYKIKVVSASNAVESSGTVIGTTNGSTNMANTGTFASANPINCSINGTDLETASSGDGVKIIKVFVKATDTGLWST